MTIHRLQFIRFRWDWLFPYDLPKRSKDGIEIPSPGLGEMSKMSVLPHLLYQFQTLPINILSYFFKLIWSEFHKFLWANKQHWVIHMASAIDWNKHKDIKLWVQLEQDQLRCPLQDLLWLPHSSCSIANPSDPFLEWLTSLKSLQAPYLLPDPWPSILFPRHWRQRISVFDTRKYV